MPVTDSGGPSVISIQINLPKLALPNVKTSLKQQTSRLSQAQRRRLKLGAAIIATLMLVSSVGLAAQHFLAHRSAVAAAKATLAKSAAASTAAKPTFQPLAPVDSTNNGIHGTPQVAYDGKRNTYSFTDTLAGQAIVVSQQPIPATYKTAVDAVSKIAVSLKASQTLATSSGAAFIANDAKSNAQTIVFSKNNLLVFVQSPFAHTSDQWQAYINGLQTQ